MPTEHPACILSQQTRRLCTFGFLSPRHWPIFHHDRRIDHEVYDALKRAGFRETIWQYVYRGQLGGLILPLHDGQVEIHVRFYRDTIEAEIEIGRHTLGHFVHPRYQAESIVLSMIQGHLSDGALDRARRLFRPHDAPPVIPNFVMKRDISFTVLALAATLIIVALVIAGYLPATMAFLGAAFVVFLSWTLPSDVAGQAGSAGKEQAKSGQFEEAMVPHAASPMTEKRPDESHELRQD